MNPHLLTRIAAVLVASSAALVHAAWPERPIHWVVPFSAGGANDLIARAAADGVSKKLGQPIIIDNKPGAGTIIGADYVAHARADGYTWLIGAASVITNSLVQKEMPYKDSDLVPVGMIANAPSVIVVNPSVPASNMKEFVAWAKLQGDKGVNWATAGTASTPHFVAEMLKETGINNITIVPFKSGNESVTAVVSGNLPATSEASIVVIPQIKAGALKAIATTYEKRITAFPELSTTKEQGYPGVNIGHWAGLFAPKDVPKDIVERMSNEIYAVVKSKEFADKLVPKGIEPAPYTYKEYVEFITNERARLGKIAKAAKMQAD